MIVDLGLQKDSKIDNHGISQVGTTETASEVCRRHFKAQIEIVRMCPPEYIAHISPLTMATLVMAAAVYVPEYRLSESTMNDFAIDAIDAQGLELVLQRFAEYWDLGRFCTSMLPVSGACDVVVKADISRTCPRNQICELEQPPIVMLHLGSQHFALDKTL